MIPKFLKPYAKPFLPYYLRLIKTRQPERSGLTLYPRYVLPSDIVIEVGARIGGGTLLLSNLAKHVYSFEPNPNSFRCLKACTNKKSNVTIFQSGCGDENGEALLNLLENDKLSYQASIKTRKGVKYDRKEKIKIIKLDDLEFDLKPTILILDCEGFEMEVLKGAKKRLNEIKKVLVEFHRLSDGTSTLQSVISELKDFNINTNVWPGWVVATKNNLD